MWLMHLLTLVSRRDGLPNTLLIAFRASEVVENEKVIVEEWADEFHGRRRGEDREKQNSCSAPKSD